MRSMEQKNACVRETHAEMFSIGGALILMACIILTVVAAMAVSASDITGAQAVIAITLTIAAWAYYLNSVTERLALVDLAIEYTSFFGRRRHVPLADLDAMLLIHQGFNLERGIETIEFRRRGSKPDRIALGPCWQRRHLEAFLHSVEEALNEPKLLEEVR